MPASVMLACVRTTRSRPTGRLSCSMTLNVPADMAFRMVSRVHSSNPARYWTRSTSVGNLPCARVASITTSARKATSTRVAGRSWIVIRLLGLGPPDDGLLGSACKLETCHSERPSGATPAQNRGRESLFSPKIPLKGNFPSSPSSL